MLTAAYTGLRWGELAGLKRKRVDLLHRVLTVTEQLTELNGDLRFAAPKTDAGRRRVKLSPFLVEQLQGQLDERAQPGPDGLVFVTKEAEMLRRSNFRRTYWLPAVGRAGLDGLRFTISGTPRSPSPSPTAPTPRPSRPAWATAR